PRRRIAVERRGTVPGGGRMAAYLRATDGARIAAFEGPGAVAPPVFHATWETGAALELLTQVAESIPSFGGVVHLESETVPLRPLRPEDRYRCRVELEGTEEDPRGVSLRVSARNWNGAEQLCSEGSARFLVRTREAARAGPKPKGARETGGAAAAEAEGWAELARWSLGSGAGRRYARASGDYNPIHLWGWTARPFGFRRPVLHGYCTEAMVAHALVERLFRGDPTALRRLRIAFRAPLLLPARACLLVREAEGRRSFRVSAVDGEKTFAEGEFTGA
ncbi:MAG TPA: MaoC/PaaZ C-terminal domain-containing protein, partial [Longimicrobiaceae bacterium]|nr:MaoC/PaaZ C-terminal domain-containing protein [Longimicrobiaceae bacterium]